MTENVDVVVVGAGFAGVTAARDLSLGGRSVVLLEARDRIGGRTHLGDAFGRKVEFGGGYVHWTQPHVWTELRRYGIGLSIPMEIERMYWLADGVVHTGTAAQYESIGAPLIERFLSDARERFPLPPDIGLVDASDIETETVRDRLDSLDLPTYERDVLEGMLSTLVCSDREQGIAQFLYWTAIFGGWGAFMEVAGHWPMDGGTGRLLDAMLTESTAEVRLSTPVASIADDGSGVTVTTRDSTSIRARHVVVAVPLNTLGDLEIAPLMPQPAAAMIEAKQPMRTSKLWVRVRGEVEPFIASAPVGKHPINTARTEYRHDGDTLIVCFCSTPAAIDGADREAVQRALKDFVPDLEVVDTASHDWVADEFSQGTWVHHRPGHLTKAAPMMRAPHGRIHFAGGDIAALGVGGIEGAIETGAAAARSVLSA